ncbi:MAG: formylglycine-generating enzyme family protein, partial [Planctomycetes bacterium]|nr:formylglycine-generating enzyme family protein [Planctomycetota bacterium]
MMGSDREIDPLVLGESGSHLKAMFVQYSNQSIRAGIFASRPSIGRTIVPADQNRADLFRIERREIQIRRFDDVTVFFYIRCPEDQLPTLRRIRVRPTGILPPNLHLLVAIAMLGFVLVGCPAGGGGDEGLGEPPVGCEDCPTETFTLPGGVSLEMVGISAGSFAMGSTSGNSDETPVHNVTLTQDFQLGKYEVTKAQWEAVMGTTPWAGQDFVLDDPNSPATQVSWNDAQSFITTLNGLTGETFRLPTEAEWEYACRGGTTTEYYFGDDSANLSDYAWYLDNAHDVNDRYAHVVGQLLP